MKKSLLLFITLTASVVTLFSQQVYNQDGIRRQHSLSQEEIEWAKRNEITVKTMPTAPPPTGQIRPVAEFEHAEAVLVRYPFGIPISLIKAMADDVTVITIVANTSEQNTVLSQYNSNGVNTANCQFLIANTNSYWTRDYGPWFMAIDNNVVSMFDFTYNRPRPQDNQINTALANYLTMNRYASSLSLTGGNYMNDGIQQAASSTLTLNENSGGEQYIRGQFQQYLGIDPYHFIPDCIVPYDNIQHIDCWGKFLAPNKVLIDSVAPGSANFDKFQYAANYFRNPQVVSSWGMPYQVYRVFAPGATSSSPKTPYSNSLILNKKVYVPIGGNNYDNAALQVYQQAMPGYTIIPVTQASSTPWLNTDALHCRTHEIADRCMLYVKHQPFFGQIENTGSVTFNAEVYSYCDNTIYPDSVIAYIKTAGNAYQPYHMDYQGNNSWGVTVAALPNGLVEYYIFAADDSGRKSCHPYIGAPDPHKFTLTGTAPELPVLVLDKTTSSVTSEGFTVIEDHITVSNIGNAQLSFEITAINFPEMLTITPLNGTVQPGGSQIITLSYDFADVAVGEYTGSFKLLSNDPLKPTTDILLHAVQNSVAPALSLDKTSSSVTSEGVEVIEDFITVSNIGNAQLSFEVTDVDFHEMLTIAPLNGTVEAGGAQIITLSYDFANVENKEYTGSFKLLSNDPLKPITEISLYAYQNYTGISDPTISIIYIYPNPANNVINICYNNDNPTKAHIYNVLGEKLKEVNLTEGVNSVNVQELPCGVYFIKIENHAFKFIRR